jgi:hypothetical protein
VSGLGIGLVKQISPIVGMDNTSIVVLWKRLLQCALLSCIAPMLPARIGMEACEQPHSSYP